MPPQSEDVQRLYLLGQSLACSGRAASIRFLLNADLRILSQAKFDLTAYTLHRLYRPTPVLRRHVQQVARITHLHSVIGQQRTLWL